MATATKVIIELSRNNGQVSRYVDVTPVFQTGAAQTYYEDVSGWDAATVQIISPSAAINFNTTNDNGYAAGSATILPVPQVPANWVAVQGVNITTGVSVTSVAASAMVKFVNLGRFLQLV